jgi:hypothetical protein
VPGGGAQLWPRCGPTLEHREIDGAITSSSVHASFPRGVVERGAFGTRARRRRRRPVRERLFRIHHAECCGKGKQENRKRIHRPIVGSIRLRVPVRPSLSHMDEDESIPHGILSQWRPIYDVTSVPGYWSENPKTKGLQVVRCKMRYHELGALRSAKAESVVEGYAGFVRIRDSPERRGLSAELDVERREIRCVGAPCLTELYNASSAEGRIFPVICEGNGERRYLLGFFRLVSFPVEETPNAALVMTEAAVWWDLEKMEGAMKRYTPSLKYRIKRERPDETPTCALGPGAEVFPLFLKVVDEAVSDLGICVYILDSPPFVDAVARAALRGVNVRVLMNAVTSPGPGATAPASSSGHASGSTGSAWPVAVPSAWVRAGVCARLVCDVDCDGYNPIMHAKVVVADAWGAPDSVSGGEPYTYACRRRTKRASAERIPVCARQHESHQTGHYC